MRIAYTYKNPPLTKSTSKDVVRVLIPVRGCVGTNQDSIIILDAEDSLDIIVESGGERECIYSWVKEPQL